MTGINLCIHAETPSCQLGPVKPLRVFQTDELPRVPVSWGSLVILGNLYFMWDVGKMFTESTQNGCCTNCAVGQQLK